ncbi:hypothetical protein BurJ1DRAFT_0817 [Burkholderiales bacterium JOSHI_001]|nr:hypothetical protein BurJ1DRAFT_0817 [Burkholderiales bacterium JOSHI_001]
MVRSEAGRQEIKAKALSLSRPARNLLLVIDGTRPVDEWLSLVHGCTDADLQQLLSAGLVEENRPTGAARDLRPERAETPLAEVLAGRDYRALYTALTQQASVHFGALKRYKMVLDVERCAGVDELRALALRWNEQIRQDKGETAARAFRAALAG